MQLINISRAELCRQLFYLSNLIGGPQPTEETVENIADNLRKYHGMTDEIDFKKSVEFALNGLIEVKGRPTMNVNYLGKCITAYKDHLRKEKQYDTDTEWVGSTLSEKEKNLEIRQGLIDRIEKWKDNPKAIPVFYHRWLSRMGVVPEEYTIHDLDYYIKEAEIHEGTNKQPLIAENIYKMEVTVGSNIEAKRLVLIDFFEHIIETKLDLNEVIKIT